MTETSPIWIGIDLGTQSVRAMAVDNAGDVLGSGAALLAGRRDGLTHEQQPEEWWAAVGAACRQSLAGIADANRIGGVAVCGTSGTVLLTDDDGDPLTPGLMYDDARAVSQAELANEHGSDLWERLGYRRIQTVWGLPKLMWLLRNAEAGPAARLAHQADFITARLAGRRLASDLSNALKTGCDTIGECWPAALMETLGIPGELLPALRRPGAVLGHVGKAGASHTGIPAVTPIVAGMTDGCASQISSGAMDVGSWNVVLGTTMIFKGVSEALVHDPNGVVYSHRSPDGLWLPGGASSSGAGAFSRYLPGTDLDALAADAARPWTVAPAYPLASGKGERFPFVAPDAEPFFLAGSQGEPVAAWLALAEGVAAVERLSLDYLDLLGFATGGRISLTGGASRSAPLNRMRATMLGRPLVVPRVAEPAFGMAVLASSTTRPLAESIAAMVAIARTFEPERRHAAAANDTYFSLVDALESRGWLPAELARHARRRMSK